MFGAGESSSDDSDGRAEQAAAVDTGEGVEPTQRRRWRRVVAIVAVVGVLPLGLTYVDELRKPGFQSVQARTVQWARRWHLGPIVDWLEQQRYAEDQFEIGGEPSLEALGVTTTTAPAASVTVTTGPLTTTATSTTTVPPRPHLEPPMRVPSPLPEALPGEGEWTPRGPAVDGLHGVYTTVVRPDDTHTSLLVFLAWADPLLATVELFPGTDLPGGSWEQPSSVPPDRCASLVFAGNGGFRMDQSRGGYYSEGREKGALRPGAASLVFFDDGSIDVVEWEREVGAADLGRITSVRQNLELMIDGGAPVGDLDDINWGALLDNTYFVWRSAWGVTADGALLYVGGPALSVDNLARILVDAGAVRAMEGDINPQWVSGNLYSVDASGECVGEKGLALGRSEGGMQQPGRRYLSDDTRDFVAVFVDAAAP